MYHAALTPCYILAYARVQFTQIPCSFVALEIRQNFPDSNSKDETDHPQYVNQQRN